MLIKKLLYVIAIMFLILPVSAKENKLYFTESGDRLYYESKLLDEDVFMNHTNMIPGKTFTDELTIENGTKTKYTLYFKVVTKEQSPAANTFLENIFMKITLDGNVIYDGKATGLDYTDQNIDLQEAILLGDFVPSKTSKMIIETRLSEEYNNTEFNELSSIDWSFYAQYEDTPPELINPGTFTQGTKNNKWIMILICLFIVLVGGYAKNRTTKRKFLHKS